MVDTVGREVLMRQLGLRPADPYAASRVQQQVLEDKATLESLCRLYGPAHRKVRELQERIRVTEYYLQNRSQAENAELRALSDQELAPMLLGMRASSLPKPRPHENSLYASYEQEKQAAIGLDHTMAQLEILDLDLSRLRGFYDVVLQRVKDIDLGQENSMLKTSVLSRPEVPDGPRLAASEHCRAACRHVGARDGLGIVYMQDLLDDHFQSPEELRMQLGLPVLAMVGKLEPLADCGTDAIHVHVQPNAVASEAFRTLRTALALADRRRNAWWFPAASRATARRRSWSTWPRPMPNRANARC